MNWEINSRTDFEKVVGRAVYDLLDAEKVYSILTMIANGGFGSGYKREPREQLCLAVLEEMGLIHGPGKITEQGKEVQKSLEDQF